MSNRVSISVKVIGLWWLLAVEGVCICYGTESVHSQTPQWLEGRASDVIVTSNLYSISQIAAKLTSPNSLGDLLKNLKAIWDDKLLVQPAFFVDRNLIACFGGKRAVWKGLPRDSSGGSEAREATILLPEAVLDSTEANAKLLRTHERSFLSNAGPIPPREHYRGSIVLTPKGKRIVTWADVVGVFGLAGTTITDTLPVDGGRSDPDLYVIRFSYPGDDPSRWGDVEMPQIRVFLRGASQIGLPAKARTPQETDVVWSILIIETSNRRQGEK